MRAAGVHRWIGARLARAGAGDAPCACAPNGKNARASVCAPSDQPLTSPHLPCAVPARQDATHAGLHAPYTYSGDERSLSTVHLAAIARVYGDHSEDILQLLRKHPVGAIPVIYKRLEQKDHEWRKARKDKIKEWRPILEQNFMKALDHQRDAFLHPEGTGVVHHHRTGGSDRFAPLLRNRSTSGSEHQIDSLKGLSRRLLHREGATVPGLGLTC